MHSDYLAIALARPSWRSATRCSFRDACSRVRPCRLARVVIWPHALASTRLSPSTHYPRIDVVRPATTSSVAFVFVRSSHRRVALSPFLLFDSPPRLSLFLLPPANTHLSFSLSVSPPKLEFYIRTLLSYMW